MDMFTDTNPYLKSLKLQQQRDTKRPGGIYLTNKAELRSSLIDAFSPPPREISHDELRMKIDKIKSKLRGGGRLTPAERQFLYEYAPSVLQRLCEIERERDAFTQRLRACESRQEMENVAGAALAAAAVSDPADPDMGSVVSGQISAALQEIAKMHFKSEEDITPTGYSAAEKYMQIAEEARSAENPAPIHYTNHA